MIELISCKVCNFTYIECKNCFCRFRELISNLCQKKWTFWQSFCWHFTGWIDAAFGFTSIDSKFFSLYFSTKQRSLKTYQSLLVLFFCRLCQLTSNLCRSCFELRIGIVRYKQASALGSLSFVENSNSYSLRDAL